MHKRLFGSVENLSLEEEDEESGGGVTSTRDSVKKKSSAAVGIEGRKISNMNMFIYKSLVFINFRK